MLETPPWYEPWVFTERGSATVFSGQYTAYMGLPGYGSGGKSSCDRFLQALCCNSSRPVTLMLCSSKSKYIDIHVMYSPTYSISIVFSTYKGHTALISWRLVTCILFFLLLPVLI